ncbi:MAG: formyl transferase [Phycisphaerae bacterium]
MKIGILTSIETRHQYFAQRLGEALDVVAVAYEETGYAPSKMVGTDLTRDETKIVLHHFAERTRMEELMLGQPAGFLDETETRRVRFLKPGELNTESTLSWLRDAQVACLVVYGTNLIKPPLLGAWPERTVNLHLGLSPYYRGTATNFYPLVNGEPQYVGATIHLIDEGIDSGPILRHVRPEIVDDDMPHTIGCKAIIAGVDAMIDSLRALEQGSLKPVAQWEEPSAKVYLRKDYHPRHVVQLYQKLKEGLIPRYVKNGPPTSRVPKLVS